MDTVSYSELLRLGITPEEIAARRYDEMTPADLAARIAELNDDALAMLEDALDAISFAAPHAPPARIPADGEYDDEADEEGYDEVGEGIDDETPGDPPYVDDSDEQRTGYVRVHIPGTQRWSLMSRNLVDQYNRDTLEPLRQALQAAQRNELRSTGGGSATGLAGERRYTPPKQLAETADQIAQLWYHADMATLRRRAHQGDRDAGVHLNEVWNATVRRLNGGR